MAELTGRTVIAYISADHVHPDLAAEVYVLDGPPDDNTPSPARAS